VPEVTPHEAKSNGEPDAGLVRSRKKSGRRTLGALAGTITLKEGWDAPLTDDQADRFLDGKEW
jgi:hypothetical protein